MKEESQPCSFCGRCDLEDIHSHHVVPRCRGGKVTAPTCYDCESFIHGTWSHNELRDTFNTVEKIKADERYKKFLIWLLKQPTDKKHRTLRNNKRAKGKYQ